MKIITWTTHREVFIPAEARNIRWLDQSDHDYELFCRFVARPLPRAQYDRFPGNNIRVAAMIEGGRIVAMAYDTPCTADTHAVSGVETSSDFRKRECARAVVSFATAHALAAGQNAMLVTRDDQPAMIRIAESLGYTQQEIINVIKWICDKTSFRSADTGKVRWLDWGDVYYPHSREKYEEMLYWGNVRMGAIIEDGKIVAQAYAQQRSKDVTEVVSVNTLPPFRGKGYARAVVSFLTAHILADGRTATMETRNDNLAMIHVADTIGYRRSEQEP